MTPRKTIFRNNLYRCYALFGVLVLTCLGVVTAQEKAETVKTDNVWQESFESDQATWLREEVDAPVEWITHDRTDTAAREGAKSERFIFKAGPGSGIYVSYGVPKIAITPDLNFSIQMKSDRVGMTLFARVVFPEDKDPDTGKPSFVVVPGTVYDKPGIWQRLSLKDLPTEMERQARLLRIRTQRKVPTTGAYVERLILNLYAGSGETAIYIDDLRAWPVEPTILAQKSDEKEMPVANEDAEIRQRGEPHLGNRRVALNAGQLRKDGNGWIFSLIDAPGAKKDTLLRAGFDLLSVDASTPNESLLETAQMGFMLAPRLGLGRLTADDEPEKVLARARGFGVPEAVAFWDLGQNLGVTIDNTSGEKQLERNRRDVRLIHEEATQAATQGRVFSDLVSGMVGGRFNGYALPQNHLELMGIDPTGWMLGKPHKDIFSYLLQRKDMTALANPGGILFWGWVSTRSEPAVIRQLWGNDAPPAWGYPRRLPEQARIDAYSIFAAGFRGWGVKGDSDLTRDSGRSMLIELGFLNEELDLVESLLSDQQGQIQAVDCHPPDPPMQLAKNGISSLNQKMLIHKETNKHASAAGVAISLAENRGRLLLVADMDDASQWQPPQMSVNNMTVRVPGAAENATPYLISPGEVRVLERKRVPGGLQIIIPEFDTTAMVLLTADEALGQWLSVAVARNRALACSLAIEQAERQVAWVTDTHNRLANDGIGVNDAGLWLGKAQERLRSAREAQAREDFSQAWAEARRGLRPLRILMRDHWNQAFAHFQQVARYNVQQDTGEAVPVLVNPVSSPGLVSFNTLPQHYLWCSWIREGRFSGNAVQGGSFDDPNEIRTAGWVNLSRELDGRIGSAMSAEGPQGQGRVLRLNVTKKNDARIDELTAFVDHPLAAVRTHPFKVNARELLRIRVRVRMPKPQQPGAGGLVVYDSLGGTALAFRQTQAITEWSDVVLYRRAVDEGTMSVTVGLAGDGDVFVDDVRVERLTENAPLNANRIAARDNESTANTTPSANVPVAEPAEAVPGLSNP